MVRVFSDHLLAGPSVQQALGNHGEKTGKPEGNAVQNKTDGMVRHGMILENLQ
jgi:hypothetical protein